MPPKKTSAKKGTTKKGISKKGEAKKATQTASGRSGDLILIDSPQVGSMPREGEVLEVIHGEVSVSYRVRWTDGHQTLITPNSGSARIVRASKRA